MILLSADELRATGTAIFRAAGADPEPTAILVNHLVDANLAGHDSHGEVRVNDVVETHRSRKLHRGDRVTVDDETSAVEF